MPGGSGTLHQPIDDRALYERLLEQRRLFRFPPDVERAFRLHYLREGRRRLRLGAWTGLLLVLVYAMWDLASFPAQLLTFSLPMRFGIIAPLYIAVLLASHYRERVGLLDALRVTAMLATGAVVTTIVGLGEVLGVKTGIEGLFIVTIAAYILTGLRTPLATICGLAMLPMELAVAHFVLGSLAPMADALIFTSVANLVGIVACAAQERTSRANFLRIQLLNQVASEDPLTGLPNRRRLEAHLGHIFPLAARGDMTVVIGLVDVDHFKAYNDRFGHAAGDEALIAVSEALCTLVRRPLDIAARIGGEEFAIAWFDTRPEAAAVLAEQLGKAIYKLGIETEHDSGHYLTISAGIVSQAPHTHSSPTDALIAADEALYEAKATGRDRGIVRHL